MDDHRTHLRRFLSGVGIGSVSRAAEGGAQQHDHRSVSSFLEWAPQFRNHCARHIRFWQMVVVKRKEIEFYCPARKLVLVAWRDQRVLEPYELEAPARKVNI